MYLTILTSSFGRSFEAGSRIMWSFGVISSARHAANGLRAHQTCTVEIRPCRIDFSRADTSLSGKANSMSRFLSDISAWPALYAGEKSCGSPDGFPKPIIPDRQLH